MPNAFISYVYEDYDLVKRLAADLQAAGVKVWLDRENIWPGEIWPDAIRSAIKNGAFFIVCFSPNYCNRQRSYANEELAIAIEEIRLRHRGTKWFLSVLLDRCDVPDLPISPNLRLKDFHWVSFPKLGWQRGVSKLVATIAPTDNSTPSAGSALQPPPPERPNARKTERKDATAKATGYNCYTNDCTGNGHASCVDLDIYLPSASHVLGIRYYSTASHPDDTPLRQVPARDAASSLIDVAQMTLTPTNIFVRTTGHNRSHNRDRTFAIQVDWQLGRPSYLTSSMRVTPEAHCKESHNHSAPESYISDLDWEEQLVWSMKDKGYNEAAVEGVSIAKQYNLRLPDGLAQAPTDVLANMWPRQEMMRFATKVARTGNVMPATALAIASQWHNCHAFKCLRMHNLKVTGWLLSQAALLPDDTTDEKFPN